MKLARRHWLTLALATPLTGCRQAREPEVVLFAAASLETAVREIATSHAKSRVVSHFASSGTLARQLSASPRADLFFAASPDHVDALERAGRIIAGTRRDLLTNVLVAVVKRSSRIAAASAAALPGAEFRHLAIGDPASVPAGAYAERYLRSIAVFEPLGSRLLPMPDVRAALAQAERRDDVVALVYRTDALSSSRVRVLFEVTRGAPPIVYPLAGVAGGPNPAAGRDFAEHLASPEARKIFERHGFGVLP